MRLLAVTLILSALLPASEAFADEVLLQCTNDTTDIFEMTIYRRPDGTLYRTELQEFYGRVLFPVEQKEVDQLCFNISERRRLPIKRVLKWDAEAQNWAFKETGRGAGHYSVVPCRGPLKRPAHTAQRDCEQDLAN